MGEITVERYMDKIRSIEFFFGKDVADSFDKALREMGFLNAPASSRHHLAYEGGLTEHSLNVADELLYLDLRRSLVDKSYGRAGVLSCTLVGLLHDLCKVDSYEREGDGWAWCPHKMVDALYEDEHGSLSARRAADILNKTGISAFLDTDSLTRIYAAITWHMGLYDSRILAATSQNCRDYELEVAVDTRKALFEAEKDPFVKLAHMADMYATHVQER